MRKTVNYLITAACLIFLCWYLPVSFFNVYACDDYWFGTNVRINGFWGNQLFYWQNWEGSYTHTFLASLTHAFDFIYIPFVGNVFSFSLFLISLSAFIRTYTNMPIKLCILSSLYIISFLFIFTYGDSEIRFWICANITYVSEISFLLLFFSIYHKFTENNHTKSIVPLILLLFLIAGCKLTFLIYFLSGLIIHEIVYDRGLSKKTIIIVVIFAIFTILNLAAPGNIIRLKDESSPLVAECQMSVIEALWFRVKKMFPFIFCSLLLFPIAVKWKTHKPIKTKKILIISSILFVTFIFDGIIMYLCFGDPGPKRVFFVAEVSITILLLFLQNNMYSIFLSKHHHWSYGISMAIILLISLSNIPMLKQVSPSIEYSKLAKERDSYVKSYESTGTLELSELPSSHLLLSSFSNEEGWLENVYLPYFQKTNNVVIKKNK